jgi:hypothetical protein
MPWVADLYRSCSDVDDVIIFQSPGRHDGVGGKVRLARELRSKRFDLAVLLQNAIGAALIAWRANIPMRAGHDSDCRGLSLTHAVQRTREIRTVHQIDYYLEMVRALGCAVADRLVDAFSAKIVLFGSAGDRERAECVQRHAKRMAELYMWWVTRREILNRLGGAAPREYRSERGMGRIWLFLKRNRHISRMIF